MWWNFVARTHEEIAEARREWEQHEVFGDVPQEPERETAVSISVAVVSSRLNPCRRGDPVTSSFVRSPGPRPQNLNPSCDVIVPSTSRAIRRGCALV